MTRSIRSKYYGFSRVLLPFLPHNMARPPKNMFATALRVSPQKNWRKTDSATFSVRTLCFSIDASLGAIGLFLPHNMTVERGQPHEGKKGKKATPRYVAEPFASLCCIDKGFGGICATLSGGNPPRYETNHRSPAMWAYNLLRTKYFHGVSSGNQHPSVLKSRYGKVSTFRISKSGISRYTFCISESEVL